MWCYFFQWLAATKAHKGSVFLALTAMIVCGFSPSAFAAVRGATPEIEARRAAIEQETRCYQAPFPNADAGSASAGQENNQQTRAICVWRPQNSQSRPFAPLPTLITADGMDGIYIALLELKPLLDSGQISPFMVVGLDPQARPTDRAAEYVKAISGVGQNGRALYSAHESWVTDFVVDWAINNQGADPHRLFIGGFSNGADFGWRMILDHPDIFAGALIHSPVGSNPNWGGDLAGHRLLISGGTQENAGRVRGGHSLARTIADAAISGHANVRFCSGPWGHEARAWRQLNGAGLIYLMGLSGAGANYQSALEGDHCQENEN